MLGYAPHLCARWLLPWTVPGLARGYGHCGFSDLAKEAFGDAWKRTFRGPGLHSPLCGSDRRTSLRSGGE